MGSDDATKLGRDREGKLGQPISREELPRFRRSSLPGEEEGRSRGSVHLRGGSLR